MRVRLRSAGGLAGALALFTGSLLIPTFAQAAQQDPFLFSFGSTTLEAPYGVAVDNSASSSSGDLYVTRYGPSLVEKYDSEGNKIGQLDNTNLASCAGASDFNNPFGVAVDPSNGNVYVSDPSSGTVSAFSPAGECLFQIEPGSADYGIAVDPGHGPQGTLYVGVDSSGAIQSFNAATGTPIATIGEELGNALSIAVNSSGDIYAVKQAESVVEYNPSGKCVNACTPIDTHAPDAVAVNGLNDHIYVAENEGSSAQIAEFAPGNSTPLIVFGQGIVERGYIFGMGVGDGRLYASNYFGNELDAFSLVPLPAVTTGEVTNPANTSATLTGHLDPEGTGEISGCYFQYGTDTSYGLGTLPCEPPPPYAGPADVTAKVTGLTAEATYHYRVVASNSNGKNFGRDHIYVPRAVSALSTEPATDILPTSVQLNASFLGYGEDTHGYFEWGPATEPGFSAQTPIEDFGAGTGTQSPHYSLGGLTPQTQYHYRVLAENGSGHTVASNERSFETQPAVKNLATEAATQLTATRADLNGSYVGLGEDTRYFFEYGTDTHYGATTSSADNGVGTGLQPVPPTELTNLQPNTTYHYRIVASNGFGSTDGPDLTFTTYDRPAISTISSSHVTATSAELHAQINPRGGDTSYSFEYGATTAYGTSIPSPPRDIGSAPGFQEVSVSLTELQVGVTYHFRVVADNQFGSTVTEDQTFGFYPPNCPNSYIRQETSSSYLPDCRAYELVSPASAGGSFLFPEGPNSGDATSPSRLSFGGTLGTIPGAGDPPNNEGDLYVATRTDEGWVTKYVGIPATEANEVNGPPYEPNGGSLLSSPAGVRTDMAMDKFLDWNDYHEFFDGPEPEYAHYTPHVWAADGSSLGVWPTAAGHPVGPILSESPDFTHYIFKSEGVELPGYETSPAIYEGGIAYDNNTVANSVALIGQESNGTPIQVEGVPQTSTDGSRILMSTAGCADPAVSSCGAGKLFMRVDDSLTYAVSKGHVVQPVGMTPDGSRVYFLSSEQLTSEDHDTSSDLYMWSEATDSLALVSVGSDGSGNTDSCAPIWIEKCGVSTFTTAAFTDTVGKGGPGGNGLSDNFIAGSNGDIYFYSPEQLAGAKGIKDSQNLYVYRQGIVQYVATFNPSVGAMVRVQVSPDDSHMAFLTSSQVTSYDNANHLEMYTYNPSTEATTCVSCRPDGEPPQTDVWASSDGLFMTNDGRTFFSTGDALVPQDTNELRDVYEYVDGRAQLISSGTSSKDATPGIEAGLNEPLFTAGLDGVSADGANVYFSTYDTLVPQDRNGPFLKFYDARTDGGFPYVAPPAPCEAADECVGAGSSPPVGPHKASASELGSRGNAGHASSRRRRKAKKEPRKVHRHRHKATLGGKR